ncbi:MAG: NAD(P)/FAD-dependent oxidoreductase [Firmicutes bacterium]|jgi:glycerol-3-phosphate dehydrogenase|nr:NAD(P)/FAD-dependent oxidoreductase [Bacillota bacterium]
MARGDPDRTFDVVIVGGGIVGAMIAREISRYLVKTALLEKEMDVAGGSTKANSAIIHAGFDPEPGTLKASLNVKGAALYPGIAGELGVEYTQSGSLVVAIGEEEAPVLEVLLERGKRNGVAALEIVGKDRLFRMEPGLSRAAVAALFAPSAGIICPFRLAIAAAENAVCNGVRLFRDCAVTGVVLEGSRVKGVETTRGFFACDYVVNAAGVHADEVARSAGDDSISIRPRRGQYHVLDKAHAGLVTRVVFPVPTKVSKGIVVTPTIDGNVLIGPTAEDIDDKEDTTTTEAGLADVVTGAARLVPGVVDALPPITQYSGLRAVEKSGDFVVAASPVVSGLVNAAGIQSPGLSAAPAIAEMVLEILREQGLKTPPNPGFNPERKTRRRFAVSSDAERDIAASARADCGHIVCRCESVTRAEVVDALRGPLGAVTLDGVKRRTRAGMGRCQGGFCTPRIIPIVAAELGVRPEDLLKNEPGSRLLGGATKAAGARDGGSEA